MPDGLLPRHHPRRRLPRSHEVVKGLLGIRGRARQAVVDRQLRGVRFDTLRIRGFDGLGRPQVGALLAGQGEFVVEGLPDQGVGEGVARDAASASIR